MRRRVHPIGKKGGSEFSGCLASSICRGKEITALLVIDLIQRVHFRRFPRPYNPNRPDRDRGGASCRIKLRRCLSGKYQETGYGNCRKTNHPILEPDVSAMRKSITWARTGALKFVIRHGWTFQHTRMGYRVHSGLGCRTPRGR